MSLNLYNLKLQKMAKKSARSISSIYNNARTRFKVQSITKKNIKNDVTKTIWIQTYH